jgi:hypothetical protein
MFVDPLKVQSTSSPPQAEKNQDVWEISSSLGGKYEAQNLLGCTAVFLIECRPTFQRYVLPQSSGRWEPSAKGSYTTSDPFTLDSLIALIMEAARTSETSVDIQLRTQQYIPEDSELQSECSTPEFDITPAQLLNAKHVIILELM